MTKIIQTIGIYTVHDAAAGAYMQPFFSANDMTALRSFKASVEDATHMFSKAPSDFTLYRMGNYDDNQGIIEPETPALVASGASLQKGAA